MREHDYGRDCWCNPYVLAMGGPIRMDRAGSVVRIEYLGNNQQAVHFEPATAQQQPGDA